MEGDKRMTKPNYEVVNSDPIPENVKRLVEKLKTNGEISDKVLEYLLSGDNFF